MSLILSNLNTCTATTEFRMGKECFLMKTLIHNVEIITMDKEDRRYKNGVILVEGDTISYVGESSSFESDVIRKISGESDLKVIDGKGMQALPGFVNAHTHIAMTAFRGYADNLPLWEWLTEKIWPMEARLEPGDTYWLSLLGAGEMIKAGITTICDMYMFMTDIAKAVSDCGMRAVLSRGLTEPQGKEEMKQKLKEVEELAAWHGKADGRISTMVSPHAVYTCSPEFIKTCIGLAEKYDVGIHIHMSETAKEVSDCIKQYGKTPVAHLQSLGVFELPTLAAHCVHVTKEDMDIMAKHGVHAVHCPSSNMKLASGFAPVDEMLSKGINVSLGTDGASSNNNLSIWKEMSLASLIAKGYTGNARALPAKTAVESATLRGAKALGLEKSIGSLEAGKKADIQLINTEGLHYYPKEDPLVHMVYSGYSSDVNTVFINGRLVMDDRRLLTIDEKEVIHEVDRITSRLRA
jgi:5-methylthioadenosine/S-adenosylhomocysteine deaminase